MGCISTVYLSLDVCHISNQGFRYYYNEKKIAYFLHLLYLWLFVQETVYSSSVPISRLQGFSKHTIFPDIRLTIKLKFGITNVYFAEDEYLAQPQLMIMEPTGMNVSHVCNIFAFYDMRTIHRLNKLPNLVVEICQHPLCHKMGISLSTTLIIDQM